MSTVASPRSAPPAALMPGRLARHRWPAAALAYGLLTICSALAGYWSMFSRFAPYDDSGFFINSIRQFIDGHPLYDRVFSDYGPFSYELWGAVFGLTGHSLTTDSGRLAAVVVWVLVPLVLGVSTQRLTGRLSLGLIVQALAFSVLTALNAEPMHASDVVCLLFAAIVAVCAFGLPVRRDASLAALGALVAALALTKVNVGGFAVIALAYAVAWSVPSLRAKRALSWPLAALVVAVGPILMSSDLGQEWAQNYAILAVASGIALLLAGTAASPAADEPSRPWMVWPLVGFVGATALILGIVFALGTSPGALFRDTVIVPSHQGNAFTLPVSLTQSAVLWSVASVAAAWVVYRLRAPAGSTPRLLGAVGRIGAALAIWFSIVAEDPLNLSPENANFALAMTLAWVAAVPSGRDDDRGRTRFVRLFVPALATLEALMAFPVAGTQVMFGSLLFVVCGAICFADGWSDAQAWGAARGTTDGLRAPGAVLAGTATALAVAFGFLFVIRPVQTNGDFYDSLPHLPIAGATRLHLPASQVATFTQINDVVRSRCKSLITLPGLLSFNLWSGLPAPSGLTAEPFWHLLSTSDERSALESARSAPGLCAVISEQQAASWGNGKPPPDKPLVHFILHELQPIGEYSGYVVAVRPS